MKLGDCFLRTSLAQVEPERASNFVPFIGHSQGAGHSCSLRSEGGCRVSWFTYVCMKIRRSRVPFGLVIFLRNCVTKISRTVQRIPQVLRDKLR